MSDKSQRRCPGKGFRYGQYMAELAKDPHTHCIRCRWVNCDERTSCDQCIDMTEEQQAVFFDLLQKKRRKEEAARRRKQAKAGRSIVSSASSSEFELFVSGESVGPVSINPIDNVVVSGSRSPPATAGESEYPVLCTNYVLSSPSVTYQGSSVGSFTGFPVPVSDSAGFSVLSEMASAVSGRDGVPAGPVGPGGGVGDVAHPVMAQAVPGDVPHTPAPPGFLPVSTWVATLVSTVPPVTCVGLPAPTISIWSTPATCSADPFTLLSTWLSTFMQQGGPAPVPVVQPPVTTTAVVTQVVSSGTGPYLLDTIVLPILVTVSVCSAQTRGREQVSLSSPLTVSSGQVREEGERRAPAGEDTESSGYSTIPATRKPRSYAEITARPRPAITTRGKEEAGPPKRREKPVPSKRVSPRRSPKHSRGKVKGASWRRADRSPSKSSAHPDSDGSRTTSRSQELRRPSPAVSSDESVRVIPSQDPSGPPQDPVSAIQDRAVPVRDLPDPDRGRPAPVRERVFPVWGLPEPERGCPAHGIMTRER